MNEQPVFNLIYEPWIPAISSGGISDKYSLRDVFAAAPHIRELKGDFPVVTISLHRLMLAILHRCFGPQNRDIWKDLWRAKKFDTEKIFSYLTQWESRFDLFHPEHPFYQVATLDSEKANSAAKLFYQMDNNTTLFNHTISSNPPNLSPAEAARFILALQAFDAGGIKSDTSANAAPLIQTAVYLIRGENLFDTLMLNLHHYSSQDEEPFWMEEGVDRPAWEESMTTQPQDRDVLGYLDLLTWQSRRLKLIPTKDDAENTIVRSAVIMKGFQFTKGYELQNKETMVAYLAIEKAKDGQLPWRAVAFQEERVLWRDSLAMMRVTGSQSIRPKILDWHNSFVGDIFPADSRIAIDVFGLAADRATLLFWRHERFRLPVKYLQEDDFLLDALDRSIIFTERVARLLGIGGPLYQLAKSIIGNKNGGKYFERFGVERIFWSGLEIPFRQFFEELPDDKINDFGQITYGGKQLPIWQNIVRYKAKEAFNLVTEGLHQSTRAVKEVSMAELRFLGQLRKIQLVSNEENHHE